MMELMERMEDQVLRWELYYGKDMYNTQTEITVLYILHTSVKPCIAIYTVSYIMWYSGTFCIQGEKGNPGQAGEVGFPGLPAVSGANASFTLYVIEVWKGANCILYKQSVMIMVMLWISYTAN